MLKRKTNSASHGSHESHINIKIISLPKKQCCCFNILPHCSLRLQPLMLYCISSTGLSLLNTEIFSEEDFLVTNCPSINETTPKEDFSVSSTSYSSYNATLMETLVEIEQFSNSPLTLIYPYPKTSRKNHML